MSGKPSVLFVCVHNAGRSQMAAAYLRWLSGGAVEVRSAGSEPDHQINPAAVEAMAEEGIDITAEQPKILTVDSVKASDVVITMGCGDTCPIFPGKRYEDWDLADPAGQGLEGVRPIRDEIRARVISLLAELGMPVSDTPPPRGPRMPTPPLPEDVAALLARPNPAVITSNRPDGQPVSVATWYLLEDDGRILVNMDASRRRLAYLREDPRISLTVLAADDWYTHVSMQGRVVEMVDDRDLVTIDRLSNHYRAGAYSNRTNKRVSARIEIERWHGWGAAKNV